LPTGLGVVIPLHRRLHPLSAPFWMLFRRRQCRHLDTWPRVNWVLRVAVDARIISVLRRRIRATSVDRSGNRPTKAISKRSWLLGLQCADTSFGASRHIQPTTTSANVRCDRTGRPGPPIWHSPQSAPLLRPCRQYLTHPCLFVVLGLDGNPIVGAAVSLRSNSRQSSICKLLDDANSLPQFAAAVLTRSCHQIVTVSLSAGVAEHIKMAGVARTLGHAGRRESHAARTTCYGLGPSIQGNTEPMDKIRQVSAIGDNLPLVNMHARSSKTDQPCLLEPCGSTVPTRLPGMLESPESPAWSEPLDLPQPKSPHSPQLELLHSPPLELPDFRDKLEPTSTKHHDPAAGMLDQLVQAIGATRAFSPCWMSSLN